MGRGGTVQESKVLEKDKGGKVMEGNMKCR